MNPELICISGNTGSGKSTLTRVLAATTGWRAFVEDANTNPYLAEYLSSPTDWGLHVQLHYLARHLKDSESIRAARVPVVRDRSFYEGAEIYARELYASGLISERDYRLYWSLYEPIVALLPQPTVLLYLYASPDLLISRISQRARTNEHLISRDRVETTCRLYDEWIGGFKTCPVVRVDIADHDFLHDPNSVQYVLSRIREATDSSFGLHQ